MTTLNYDDLATEYARHRRTYPGLIEHIVRRAGVTAEHTVLEVGCGTANHVAAVRRETGAKCFGVEPSEQMLAVARTQPEDLDLRQGYAQELDFPAATFDLIMSVDMIHYVREPLEYFRRAFGALKPGGYFVTVTDSDWIIRNRIPMARYFPGTIDAEADRYHPIPRLSGDLALAGFGDLNEHVVESEYELADSTRFRDKSYSCLHLIGDDEFADGLAALDADLAAGPLTANLRSLVLWGRRPQ
ncbi:class I SAM-dependent methyltransferase [Actinokineospora xionganensis]|uniref:Class I SAM-dependent methyltransferase n=1 Tax=Actinokineospora xionganensis TaxID=2684470 RepID=A0ABR7L7J2_9PSEU|nr:class I SAM-dependent methyltransferase [Actinokineospora xionganensis]MBC6448650.1 class I SAM-dependent methyltransferase [Actinokineospora xionganensis]